jgi:hypothetical protein
MDGNTATLTILAAIGVGVIIYEAQKRTGDTALVPDVQGEAQVMGMGVHAGMKVEAGSPLDTNIRYHGWHPGFDPAPSDQPVTYSKHRYPAIPGGNISTIMHKGWGSMNTNSPAGGDWFTTPPEAAVI